MTWLSNPTLLLLSKHGPTLAEFHAFGVYWWVFFSPAPLCAGAKTLLSSNLRSLSFLLWKTHMKFHTLTMMIDDDVQHAEVLPVTSYTFYPRDQGNIKSFIILFIYFNYLKIKIKKVINS